jgi:hypothetical protein
LFRCLIVEEAKFGEKLAGPGGIEPPNAGIKIRLVIQRFQGVLKKCQNAFGIVDALL